MTRFFSAFCLHCSFAQNQTNIWYFGLSAGFQKRSGGLGCALLKLRLAFLKLQLALKELWRMLPKYAVGV